jgi:uncharacterized protein YbaR (Trm112 family)
MFIELTDILRCPQAHDEQFLVLIPYEMAERSVRSGRLGCPVCHREYSIANGVVDFAGAAGGESPAAPDIDPTALAAFLGLSGPGGYVGLVGAGSDLAQALITAVPGVHFVGVNSAAGSRELPMFSLVSAGTIPIKSRSLRGVALFASYGDQPEWLDEAARVLLPGLRVVGQGPPPARHDLEMLGSAESWFVAQKR